MTVPVAFVISWLSMAGYGPAQRDAVLWSAQRESGMRSDAVSKGGRHAGLFQHSGARRLALFRFAARRGKPWADAVTQLAFMDLELRSLPMARRFFALTSTVATRALFCLEFEKAARCPSG